MRERGRAATAAVIPGRFALSVGRPPVDLPGGWSWVRLTDVARLESGHTPSRRVPSYWDGRIPWIGVRDATGNHGRRITQTLQSVTQAGIDNSSARVLPANTICLSRTASVGYVVAMGVPMATSQDFVNWVCSEALHWRFLMYVLLAEREALLRYAHGTTHQTIYFPEVKAFWVAMPRRAEQDAIVATLGALDDKIESNHRMSDALGRLLALDHLGRARSGTGHRALGDIVVALHRGIGPRYTESGSGTLVLNQRCIREHSLNFDFARRHDETRRSTRRREIKIGDLLVNSTGVGTLGRVAPVEWLPEDHVIVDSHVTVVRAAPHEVAPWWLVSELLAREDDIVALGHGSTGQTELTRARLASLPVTLPPREVQEEHAARAEATARYRAALAQESRTLTAIRDALLPKLVSGQIRVPLSNDPEEQVGAAVEALA